jgi:cytochrome c-type biogenesis protein CcmF
VGAPFFNLTFGPLMLPLLIAVPFGPYLAWKRGDLLGALQRLWMALAVAVVVTLGTVWFVSGGPILAALGVGLAVWVMAGALSEIVSRARFREVGLAVGLRRLAGLPRSAFGTALAHAGVGVTLLGIVGVTAFESETITLMRPGDTARVGAYELRFERAENRRGPNFTELVVTMAVLEDGVVSQLLYPAKRVYTARQMPTTESAILTHGASQLYVTLGDDRGAAGLVVRMWDKPLVLLIWIGSLVMMAGGVLSLSDRRLRVGAPKPARKPAAVAAE